MEDGDEVRTTAADMLAELGYRVLRARDADAARVIVDSGAAIELLFTSDYTHNAIVHGGRLDPAVELLSKPYTREGLARKLRQVLDRPAPAPAAEQLVTG